MRTPVIIGVGQVVHRAAVAESKHVSPTSLAADAAMQALADAGLQAKAAARIDVVAAVRLFADSYEGGVHPFGSPGNLPRAIAARIGASPARAIYSSVGGQSPQRLTNELCNAVAEGRHDLVLIVGAEATALLKAAQRGGVQLDWSDAAAGELEDRGLGGALVNKEEARHRLFPPVNVYALIEHALRHRLGRSSGQHREAMARSFSRFSEIAAGNPYAQFPTYRDTTFLATVSDENYWVSNPFTKWMVAQDAVNQGAAVLIASTECADELGVAMDRRVYLHGHADVDDLPLTQRPGMDRSAALDAAASQALCMAHVEIDQVRHLDFYSCFPCAVSAAREAFGVPESDPRDVTVTGGLPFFGGAGNAYSLFAIAEMVVRLRQDPGSFGIVSANGGYLSKESVGIYSTTKPAHAWTTVGTPVALDGGVEIADSPSGPGTIETYTVDYQKGRPTGAWIVGRLKNSGKRFVAIVHRDDRATLAALISEEPIGRTVELTSDEKRTYVRIPDAAPPPIVPISAMRLEHVQVQREGRLTIVTLNRPELMNALHQPAHEELAAIFDEFAADPDQWVAIITGAGDRAFCAGNDLRHQASGGGLGWPTSGFAGLTSRTGLTKPIIAAVNGVCMGGGLEIALACDLVVAAENAAFSLPEVRVGLAAIGGGLQRLPRQIGLKAAFGMILTGRKVLASEARELGLVNEVVPVPELMTAARRWAELILKGSPMSVRASKEAVDLGLAEPNLQSALKNQLRYPAIRAMLKSEDFVEGPRAFAQKRKPNWKGR